MATRLFASVLLVVLLLISISASFSSARLLNDVNLAAAEVEPTTFNLVLPCADKGVGAVRMVTARKPSSEMRLRVVAIPRRARKYGPLVLNMLPKGTVPPSGPSKGTNDINN